MKTAGKLKKSLLTRRKRWISLLNSAEICKKHSVTQVNFHLYHYAGNNPIKYTDPDGRDTALAKDKKDAMGMGHMGVCVQTGEKTWSYFEVYAFDKNGKQAYQHVKVDEIRETTILSKNDMVIPTGVSGGHEAGVIQRDFESYEAMVEYLKKREFSELLYFETTPEQDKINFDSAVDKGKGFSGYNLFRLCHFHWPLKSARPGWRLLQTPYRTHLSRHTLI